MTNKLIKAVQAGAWIRFAPEGRKPGRLGGMRISVEAEVWGSMKAVSKYMTAEELIEEDAAEHISQTVTELIEKIHLPVS